MLSEYKCHKIIGIYWSQIKQPFCSVESFSICIIGRCVIQRIPVIWLRLNAWFVFIIRTCMFVHVIVWLVTFTHYDVVVDWGSSIKNMNVISFYVASVTPICDRRLDLWPLYVTRIDFSDHVLCLLPKFMSVTLNYVCNLNFYMCQILFDLWPIMISTIDIFPLCNFAEMEYVHIYLLYGSHSTLMCLIIIVIMYSLWK